MILNLPRCHDVDIFTGSSSKPGRHMTGRGLLQAAMCHLFWFAADCQYFRAKINSIIFVRGGGAEQSVVLQMFQSHCTAITATSQPLAPHCKPRSIHPRLVWTRTTVYVVRGAGSEHPNNSMLSTSESVSRSQRLNCVNL